MSKQLRVIESLHVPTSQTREHVCRLVSCGLNVTEIAFVFGAMEHEIHEHYAQEIEHGNALVTAMVGGALLKQALRGDVNASRFWLQARAKWATPQQVEVTGRDGGPIQIEERKALMERVLGLTKVVRDEETEERKREANKVRPTPEDAGTGKAA